MNSCTSIHMTVPCYHLHLDAAHLPSSLKDLLIQQNGYHSDDFPHELEVEGKKYQARHLTKYLHAPVTSKQVKEQWEELKNLAEAHSFLGLIQCEFVMDTIEWKRENTEEVAIMTPFKITSRQLSSTSREKFKKHELHLELIKKESSPSVINTLRNCGFHILENEQTITFTASGGSRELLKIRKLINQFFKTHGKSITGSMTYEATAFWKLQGINSETLPEAVDSIMVYH